MTSWPTTRAKGGRPRAAHRLLSECVQWQDHISIDANVLVGKPVVKGTRIAVELIIDLLGRGYTVEQVLEQYDHITSDDVRACLAYAAEVLQSEKVYAVR